MEFTGERFVPTVHGDIELEHLHRYALARTLVTGLHVLDIASGEGYGSAMLAETALHVTGVDIAPDAVAHARQRYLRPNLQYLEGSCSAIPLPDHSIDAIVSFETIEHHDQHTEMMQEITRVLRPNGLLIISSPDKQHYSVGPAFHNEYHVKELYENEFRNLLGQYFSHCRYWGQRIVHGSAILATEHATPVCTWQLASGNAPTEPASETPTTHTVPDQTQPTATALPETEAGTNPLRCTPGLAEPQYWVAIASNGPLPDMPSGLLETPPGQVQQYWQQQVENTANDFRREIDRIAAERDTMLLERDTQWLKRLQELTPHVSVVVVNYNGEHFLPALLDSLQAQTLPAHEVIVVDNASTDGSIDLLKARYPWVKRVESQRNTGFTGGNNQGVKAASSPLVALLNNDTVADPRWLECLVESWMSYKALGMNIGAIAPKIRFFRPFIDIQIKSATRPGTPDDSRTLGLALDLNETRVHECDYLKPLPNSGFHQEEHWPDGRTVRWTQGVAHLLLPVAPVTPGQPQTLRLSLCVPAELDGSTVTVLCEGKELGFFTAHSTFETHELTLPPNVLEQAFWVINNAGSELDDRGNAADLGINQRDLGQFDQAGTRTAFCGCSVLFDRHTFLRLGGFDDHLFMYYEDADLSWRMRSAGLMLGYDPRAIVRHIHAGSSVEWSPGFRYHVTRNQRIITLKNAPLRYLPRVLAGMLQTLLRGPRRILLQRPRPALATQSVEQITAFATLDALLHTPRILAHRMLWPVVRVWQRLRP